MIFVKLIFVLIFFSFNLLVHQAQGAITDEEAKNTAGEVLFHVYNGNKVNVANRHRATKPSLKFSLHGTEIDKIEMRNSSSIWTWHLADKSTVDFSVVEKGANVSEYYLLWHGGGQNVEREVCFSYGFNDAKWFNAYQSMHAQWPMDVTKSSPKQQFNYLFNYHRLFNPKHSYEHLFILEQLFLNSDGFAILLDYQSPLFIRRDPNGTDPQLCFSVNNKEAPYMESNTDPTYLDQKIHLFTSTNTRTVTDFVVHHSGYIPKPTAVPDESMISHPNWFNWEINQPDLHVPGEILKEGFPGNGKFVMGHIEDIGRFGAMIEMNDSYPYDRFMSGIHAEKFQVGMQIGVISHPNLSFLDLSNPEESKNLLSLFTEVRHQKKIDTFLLFAGNDVDNLTTLHDPLYRKYPSLLTQKYIEIVTQIPNASIISEYAFRTQHLPVWVRMSNYEHTPLDQQLHELIPNMLSISIAGYSFVVPYSVGGLSFNLDPTADQMIRWIQAVTFMPSISLTRLPWDYIHSTEIIPIFKKQLALHAEHVPLMLELAKKRITDGSPIVRPLWYTAPDDPKAYTIGDQYMLGDDILVAPVFKEKHVERHVYFPAGTWIDQHGKSYTGPSEVKVAVPLDELAYFKRKH